jgi:hypothetical protein
MNSRQKRTMNAQAMIDKQHSGTLVPLFFVPMHRRESVVLQRFQRFNRVWG